MTIRRLYLPNTARRATVALQKRADSKDGELPDITGLAAVFYNANDSANTQYRLWDNYFERIMPGAFDRAVKEDDVRALQNHDPRLLLGRSSNNTLQLEVTKEGLSYRISPPPTMVGRDTVTLLERGDLDGSSFAFTISRGGVEWTEEEVEVDGNKITLYIRNIKSVDLYDVGPVTYPAYSGTTAGTRSPCMFLDRRSDNPEVKLIEEEFRGWRDAVALPDRERRERELRIAELS
ncbi:MAG: HK97 family phage prohead protease [Planctomyces sp.]|nr:HK97 family phage prohead protease [Planctomyces sp.]